MRIHVAAAHTGSALGVRFASIVELRPEKDQERTWYNG